MTAGLLILLLMCPGVYRLIAGPMIQRNSAEVPPDADADPGRSSQEAAQTSYPPPASKPVYRLYFFTARSMAGPAFCRSSATMAGVASMEALSARNHPR